MDLKVIPIVGLPMIQDGDDIAKILAQHTDADGPPLEQGDILVVAQKILSKSEGRLISLKNVVPSTKAIEPIKVLTISSAKVSILIIDKKLCDLSINKSSSGNAAPV